MLPGEITGKKSAIGESLRKLVSWGSQRSSLRLTVGTTAVPNLAKGGKRARKSVPLSQILAPPVTDPCSGFTPVRVGVGSPSVCGGVIARFGAFQGPAFRGG